MDLAGFFTGIASTVACAVFGLMWKQFLLPWWQDRSYAGIRLDGKWQTEIKAVDGTFVLVLDVHQKFHDINGTLIITKIFDGDNKCQTSELEVIGCIFESFLQLRCKSKINGKLSFSTFLLKIEEGGNKLNGVYALRDLKADDIKSVDVGLSRS